MELGRCALLMLHSSLCRFPRDLPPYSRRHGVLHLFRVKGGRLDMGTSRLMMGGRILH